MSSAAELDHRAASRREFPNAEIASAIELGWYDFITTYRRSFFGPLWLPVQMLAFIAIITLVLGRVFDNDPGLYAVYVALGLLGWEMVSSSLLEGPQLFVQKANLIKSVPIKLSALGLRKLVYLLCRLAFHIPVAIVLLLIFGKPLTPVAFLAILALPVLVVNAYCILTVCGFIGVYLRDFQFLMQTVLRFLFFMTPIFWYGDRGARSVIAAYNPFTYFLEILRAPLMGTYPTMKAWAIVLSLTFVGILLSWLVQTRLKRAIVFWL